jgi:hypothetical protein
MVNCRDDEDDAARADAVVDSRLWIETVSEVLSTVDLVPLVPVRTFRFLARAASVLMAVDPKASVKVSLS